MNLTMPVGDLMRGRVLTIKLVLDSLAAARPTAGIGRSLLYEMLAVVPSPSVPCSTKLITVSAVRPFDPLRSRTGSGPC